MLTHPNTVPEKPLPARAWLTVGLLWFIICHNFGSRIMLTTMHDSITTAMPITETQFGLLTSVFLWAYALINPLGGFLADRFNRSWVLIVSMFAWSAVTWLTGYVQSFEQLLVMRILLGLCTAFNYSAGLALVSDYHRGPTRSLATGIHNSGYTLGVAFGSMGGLMADWCGWRTALQYVGLVGMAYSLVLVFTLRDLAIQPRSPVQPASAVPKVKVGEAIVSLFSSGSFILMCFNGVFCGSTAWVLFGWLPVMLQEKFHLTQGVAGISATGYGGVASLAGLLLGGIWADRWCRTTRRARMYVPAIGVLLAVPCLLAIANANFLLTVIVSLILYRIVTSFVDANRMPVICEIVDERYRATAYGIVNMMAAIGGGVSVYLVGMFRDLKSDPAIVFYVLAGFNVILAALFYYAKPRVELPMAVSNAMAK
jgi:MFS family permease